MKRSAWGLHNAALILTFLICSQVLIHWNLVKGLDEQSTVIPKQSYIPHETAYHETDNAGKHQSRDLDKFPVMAGKTVPKFQSDSLMRDDADTIKSEENSVQVLVGSNQSRSSGNDGEKGDASSQQAESANSRVTDSEGNLGKYTLESQFEEVESFPSAITPGQPPDSVKQSQAGIRPPLKLHVTGGGILQIPEANSSVKVPGSIPEGQVKEPEPVVVEVRNHKQVLSKVNEPAIDEHLQIPLAEVVSVVQPPSATITVPVINAKEAKISVGGGNPSFLQNSTLDGPKLEAEMEADLTHITGEVIQEKKEDKSPSDEAHPAVSEDMPSFNEWSLKKLAEQENIGGAVPAAATGVHQNKPPPQHKLGRQKNYASADCGAKIIATNAEAQGASAVLNTYHDEYMLNPCIAKIWLVIELCEPIQARTLEMANFELFSSSPRDFSVFSSDRYPAREWTSIGAFTAKDDKTVQSFSLDQRAFHKIFKIEMASHYGSEHFCPVSLVRVFGSSELEVLDPDDDDNDRDDEGSNLEQYELDEESLQGKDEFLRETDSPPQNLFGSAKDAVLSIVKKAAEALTPGKKPAAGQILTNASNLTDSKSTSTHENDKGLFMPSKDSFQDLECITIRRSGPDGCEISGNWSANMDPIQRSMSCEFRFLVHLLEARTVVKCLDENGLHLGNSDVTPATNQMCLLLQVILGPIRSTSLSELYALTKESSNKPFSSPSSDICLQTNAATSAYNITAASAMHDSTTTAKSAISARTTGLMSDSGHTDTAATMKETRADLTRALPPSLDKVSAWDPESDSRSPDESFGITTAPSRTLHGQIHPTKTLKTDPSPHKHDGMPDVPAVDGSGQQTKLSSQESQSLPLTILDSETLGKVKSLPDKDNGVGVEVNGTKPKESELQSSKLTPDAISLSDIPMKKHDGSEIASAALESMQDDSGSHDSSESLASADVTQQLVSGLAENGGTGSCVDPVIHLTDAVFADMSDIGLIPSMTTATASSSSSSSSPALNNKIIGTGSSSAVGSTSATPAGQKESVFVRLTNRIKALELNMSLSGQYLEELSQRYRKQMEEMQRAFNKTIVSLNETAREAYERDMQQQELINALEGKVATLNELVSSLASDQEDLHIQVIQRHLLLMVIEVVVILCAFIFCLRRTTMSPAARKSLLAMRAADSINVMDLSSLPKETCRTLKRCNSVVGTIGHLAPETGHKRRPSEEALNITGTYDDLMIVEPSIPIMIDQPLPKVEGKKKKNKNRRAAQSCKLVRCESSAALGSKQNALTASKHNIAGLLFHGGYRMQDLNGTRSKDDIGLTNSTKSRSSSGSICTLASSSGKISAVDKRVNQVSSTNKSNSHLQSSESNLEYEDVPLKRQQKNSLMCCNGYIRHSRTVEDRKEAFSFRRVLQKLYSSPR